jgi:hypothetical protein
MATGEHVEMQVVDGLATVASFIGDDPVPGVPKAQTQIGCHREEALDFFRAGACEIGREILGVTCRRDEHVRRRLRVEVAKRHDMFIAIDLLRRDIVRYDFAKNTIRRRIDHFAFVVISSK